VFHGVGLAALTKMDFAGLEEALEEFMTTRRSLLT